MNSIFSNLVSDNTNTVNFDDLYKTADILICNKVNGDDGISGVRYLGDLNNDERLNLFKNISFLKETQIGAKFPFQSWRHFVNEHESIDTYRVSEKIKLFLDSSKIANGYSYNLGTIQDITKSGVFGTLQNIAEGANQFTTLVKGYKGAKEDAKKTGENFNFGSGLEYQDRVNIYKNVPYFQDISTSSIDSLSFTFNWGQFGLYNCELEVVKPIFALAHCFGSSIDSYGYIDTPFDAKFDVTTRAYSALFNTADDDTDAGRNISSTLSNITNSNSNENSQESSTSSITKLTQSLNELYTNVAGQTRVRAALIRIAGAVFGPVYVSDVTWEFDYSQQDRYGMPYKGKITLGGIKPVLIDDISTFRLTGGVM